MINLTEEHHIFMYIRTYIQVKIDGESYTLVTRLSWLQVMWNHVHGLTRVGSQLWSTLSGSDRLRRNVYRASPSELPLTKVVRVKVRETQIVMTQMVSPSRAAMVDSKSLPEPKRETRIIRFNAGSRVRLKLLQFDQIDFIVWLTKQSLEF